MSNLSLGLVVTFIGTIVFQIVWFGPVATHKRVYKSVANPWCGYRFSRGHRFDGTSRQQRCHPRVLIPILAATVPTRRNCVRGPGLW